MTTPKKAISARLTIRTWAEGMFSALAHDLELVSTSLDGAATPEGDGWKFEGSVQRDSIAVEGVIKRGALDKTVLKDSDKRDILNKMCGEVLTSPAVEVRTSVALPAQEGGSQSIRLTLTLASKSIEVPVQVAIDRQSDRYRISGNTKLSLSSLGIKPIKGPLGAFKLKDGIDLAFDVTFG